MSDNTPNRMMSEGFYLQDSRSHIGNDMVFWAKDGCGYTTDIDKAHIFTREEAMAKNRVREDDIPWPVAYINARWRPAVDFQYCKIKDALRDTGVELNKPKGKRRKPPSFQCQQCLVFMKASDKYGPCPHCGGNNQPNRSVALT